MSKNLFLNLHDITLSLTSDNEDFISFARTNLPSAILANQKDSRIDVNLHWDNELSIFGLDRLSRRISIGEQEIIQTQILSFPGLQLRYSENQEKIFFEAAFRQPHNKLNFPFKLRQKESSEKIYATLLYFLVYFPLIWFAERNLMLFPMHAGAIAVDEKAILFTGLGGIGKSTITMAFLRDPVMRIMSENLILHNQKNIFAFPELIHLDSLSSSLLSGMTNRLKPTGKTYSHNRACYDISPTDRIHKAKPVVLINLRQSNKLQISPIASDIALEIIVSNDLLAREINEYSQQRAVYNFLNPNFGGYQRRFDSLQEIIGDIACYDLWIKPHEDLGQVVNLVRDTVAL